MSKSKEELNALKKELEDLNEKCRELTEEELEQVTGGNTDFIIGPFDITSYQKAQTIAPYHEEPYYRN